MSTLHLVHTVKEWLVLGNVRPSLEWPPPGDPPSLQLGSDDFGRTFGLIALELTVAVTRSEMLSVCDGCHTVYTRRGRKAAPDRRNYCARCRQGPIPARDRQRAHRRSPNSTGR